MRGHYRHQHLSKQNKLLRLVWRTVWLLLFRPSPRWMHGWRRLLLRAFGARMGSATYAYPSVAIWAPWNLDMRDGSCLSHFVDCYCVDRIVIGRGATVSQYSFLCTASHDYQDPAMPLITAPIHIGDFAWVAAGVFVAPGVTVGEGAVAHARSVVTRDVAPWSVVAGSPAQVVGERERQAIESAGRTGPVFGIDDNAS